MGVEGCTLGHWGRLEGGKQWQRVLRLKGCLQGWDLIWGMLLYCDAASGSRPLSCQVPVQEVEFTPQDPQLFSGTKPGSSWASRLLFWAPTPVQVWEPINHQVALCAFGESRPYWWRKCHLAMDTIFAIYLFFCIYAKLLTCSGLVLGRSKDR